MGLSRLNKMIHLLDAHAVLERHNRRVREYGKPYVTERTSLFQTKAIMKPRSQLLVICCTNPLVFFEGLQPGDCEIYRNPGSVINPEDLSLKATLNIFLRTLHVNERKTIVVCQEYPDAIVTGLIQGADLNLVMKQWARPMIPAIKRSTAHLKQRSYPDDFKSSIPSGWRFSPSSLFELPEPAFSHIMRMISGEIVHDKMSLLVHITKNLLQHPEKLEIAGWLYNTKTGLIEAI